jgi:hypothetical protein
MQKYRHAQLLNPEVFHFKALDIHFKQNKSLRNDLSASVMPNIHCFLPCKIASNLIQAEPPRVNVDFDVGPRLVFTVRVLGSVSDDNESGRNKHWDKSWYPAAIIYRDVE